jgi:hypothetical protein
MPARDMQDAPGARAKAIPDLFIEGIAAPPGPASRRAR